MIENRDSYIDFLRGFGLLLLVVAHTAPPEWLLNIRAFDVPLMVFISAVCYKSLKGYLRYFIKRVKRIYIPVLVFLTIFFSLYVICFMLFNKPWFSLTQIIGSYLLLNSPSIGYVWIMRVFIMMSLIMPFLDLMARRMGFKVLLITILVLIIMQTIIVYDVETMPNKYIRFVFDQYILYAFGYTPLALVGLRIRDMKSLQSLIILLTTGALVIVLTYLNGWNFNPQSYKYPPQSLYVLYGLMVSFLLWSIKPVIQNYTGHNIFRYLSENSMWIYLWHIIPVYIVARWNDIPNFWLGRFTIVLCAAILLNMIYQRIILFLPQKVYKLVR